MTQTAAATRLRALPSTPSANWYPQVPTTGMRDRSAVAVLNPTHNSITRSTAVPAGVVGFGAAKQAAPPRGVPR
jgi:hypothetical protein